MEFCHKKCGVLILKKGKYVKFEGIDLPEGQKIKNSGEGWIQVC